MPPAEALDLLDRVPERVPVVEDLAQPALAQVLADDPSPSPGRALDELAHVRRRGRAGRSARGSASTRSRIRGSAMNPHLTTSASPATKSCCGSDSSAARSQSTPAGGWKAPTRFLPSAVLIPVLPPTAASTIAEQRRRHLHDADAAQPGRRDEPAEVGGRAAADADDGVGAREAGLAEDAATGTAATSAVLASSASGTSATDASYPCAAQVVADGLGGRRQRRRVHDEHALRTSGAEQVGQLGRAGRCR